MEPAWIFNLPKLIANDKAMFAGIILGIVFNCKKLGKNINKVAEQISIELELIISKLLKVLTYLIPLFIAGFVAKFKYDGIVSMVISNFTCWILFVSRCILCYSSPHHRRCLCHIIIIKKLL